MVLEDPLYQDGNDYPARLDRQFIEDVFDTEGVIKPATGALAVSVRGAGANMSVDVAAGRAVITGDDEANQGSYRVLSTAVENLAISAAPGSDSRIDLVVARVRDSAVTGGVSNDWLLEVIPGEVAVAPVAPAVPNTAVPLAQVLVATGTLSITAGMITDRRTTAGSAAYVPTGAVKMNVMTFESTTATTASNLATVGPTASVTVPPSGKVRVDLQAWIRGAASTQAYLGFALSGAVTAAASTDEVAEWSQDTSEYLNLPTSVLIEDLTPGATLTVTAKYWTVAGTAWFGRRRLIVTPQ